MYGYIYKTTNLVTNKIYIGQKHSNRFLGQRYLGSGKIIRREISFYGKENFQVELIEEVETKELMDEREIYWIKFYNSTNKEIGYNLSEGGNVNRTLVGENTPFYGKHHTKESRKKNSESCKGRVPWNKGLTKDDPRVENYAKHIQESLKKNGHHSKGSTWINKDGIDRMISKDLLDWFISNGWFIGRTKLNEEACKKHSKAIKGRIRVNNGIIERTIYPQELDEFISQGYIKGRLKFKK